MLLTIDKELPVPVYKVVLKAPLVKVVVPPATSKENACATPLAGGFVKV
jgi:hypothetical protein